MAAPRYEIVQKHFHNPNTSGPLIIPIHVLANTPDDVFFANIKANSARDLPWVKAEAAHQRSAILVGGGPSAADHIDDIRRLQAAGGMIFAMNGASRWLRGHGITPDYQVISDAKPETASLVDPEARAHLIASQVNPATLDAAPRPTLWHLEIGDVEDQFPAERRRRGGYALIGGGAATGNSALCVAYAMGYRDLHVFGYDSSHRDGAGHAYRQAMNDLIPTVTMDWAGRSFECSVAMKAQAEKFQITGQALKAQGCTLTVYGDGLLQHMWRTPASNLTERDKYRLMWSFDGYRDHSPGEALVSVALPHFAKPGPVIDFGCGTGRAALAFHREGFDVVCVDFADNCRDDEALSLPFLEWDLSRPCPLRAPYGFCTDVMEHIPTEQVDTVIRNIMGSAETVFFQIATVPDVFGSVINQRLHLTVQSHAWWKMVFSLLGYRVSWDQDTGTQSQFVVTRETVE